MFHDFFAMLVAAALREQILRLLWGTRQVSPVRVSMGGYSDGSVSLGSVGTGVPVELSVPLAGDGQSNFRIHCPGDSVLDPALA